VRRRLPIPIALAVLVAFGGTIARGELTQKGDLIVALQGRITPHALPRYQLAPVALHVEGSIKTADGSKPPRLRRLTVAINRHGRLFNRGLPVCTTGQLELTTSEEALTACRPALIGRGHFQADVSFPTLSPFPANGTLLAFNGRRRGRPAILLHIYGAIPVENTFVLPLTIVQRPNGTFGSLLTAKFPTIAADAGYVTGVEFTIARRYTYKGHRYSFLSASCAAPAGFPGAVFPFAKGTFDFVNGQTLTTTLSRDCKVKQ
jgi:hypothetical protein